MATGNRSFQVNRHQLVIAEARQRSAHPHEDEQQEARLPAKPEHRKQNGLQQRGPGRAPPSPGRTRAPRPAACAGPCGAPDAARDTGPARLRRQTGTTGSSSSPVLDRPKRQPAAEEQQRGERATGDHVGVLGHEKARRTSGCCTRCGNPPTSSFSASGRSNGTRLVSAKPAIRKMT